MKKNKKITVLFHPVNLFQLPTQEDGKRREDIDSEIINDSDAHNNPRPKLYTNVDKRTISCRGRADKSVEKSMSISNNNPGTTSLRTMEIDGGGSDIKSRPRPGKSKNLITSSYSPIVKKSKTQEHVPNSLRYPKVRYQDTTDSQNLYKVPNSSELKLKMQNSPFNNDSTQMLNGNIVFCWPRPNSIASSNVFSYGHDEIENISFCK